MAFFSPPPSAVFFFFHLTLFVAGEREMRSTKPGCSQPLFLPLKTQQIAPPPLLLPPAAPGPAPAPAPELARTPSGAATANINNRVYFHHGNVSLTVVLSVGSPPQNVSMVLDTGSELSWVLSSSSSFNPNSSSSYHPIPCSSHTCKKKARDLPAPAYCDPSNTLCHVSISYADASTVDGDLAADVLHIGQEEPFKAIFGCMRSAYSSTSGTSTTGLLGMNRGSLSLVTQMGTPRFSYCISERDSSGVLLLGEADLPFSLTLNYTPLIQMSIPLPYFDRVAYSVELQGIRVSNTLLPIPKSVLVPDHTGAGQTMVDSGTQFTFLLGPAYTVLKTEFLRQTKGVLRILDDPDFVYQGAFDACFLIPASTPGPPPAALPEVTMVFNGAEMTVKAERLLYRAEGHEKGGDGIWCLTFGNSDLVPIAAYVIGHHHQQNVWVEYDLRNGRVGFAPVQCDDASRRLSHLAAEPA